MGIYFRPTALPDALAWRAAGGEILSGGTDFWPAQIGKPTYPTSQSRLLDLSAILELRGISHAAAGMRIGALTTWTDLAEMSLPPALHALQSAAREVGGRQIQNRGTIGGNLCNASPAADGVPPLLALDASVELANVKGVRTLPLDRFLLGARKTALAADEVLTAISIPRPHAEARSLFIKLGARKYQLISIVMGCAVVQVQSGRVEKAALAIGACSPVALRLTGLEQALSGKLLADLPGCVVPAHLAELSPIDDVRADAQYRRDAALVVVRRLLASVAATA
jgi:CO/xanthine dehydrogenase FAD-binding subunit